MLSSVLLGLAFLSLAVLLSVLARPHARLGPGHCHLWFFFVLVFDLLLLGAGGQRRALWRRGLCLLLLLNPADVFRILNVFRWKTCARCTGLATVVPLPGNP